MPRIPLVDLKFQHRRIEKEIWTGFERVFRNSSFILGEEVASFEQAFARFSGVAHCVGVANGTDALEMILRANGIGTGDEVLVPANTFIATALAVARAGAKPVLVDCDPVFQLMDPQQVARRVGARARALIPVHLFGQLAPMEEFKSLAKSFGLVLIEDAAQAHGARRKGLGAGKFGIAAGVSFYPGKNLGAYGDGGAVLTDNDEMACKLRALRNYGSEVKYHHPELGFNSRLDTLQAVVLQAKLKWLTRWNELRCQAARRYDELLREVPEVVPPTVLSGNEPVWHLYVVRVPRRDKVVEQLNSAGVGAVVHYPVPIHLQKAFAYLGHKKGDFPVAETAASEILSLPLYPGLTQGQQERVVRELRKALR